MKTRTHFAFRVDTWTADGESIVEHIAGVEDYQVALATFRAAWPAPARKCWELAGACEKCWARRPGAGCGVRGC